MINILIFVSTKMRH